VSENPYESPFHMGPATGLPGAAELAPRQVRLGPFVMTIVIMDLVLCSLRLLVGVFSTVGYMVIPESDPLRVSVMSEIVSAFGIAAFGLPANILILMKNRFGILLAAGSILFTAYGLFVGVWQARLMMPANLSGPEGVGFLVGAVFSIGIRLALLALYVVAVLRARRILASHSAVGPTQW
jgi:hypothetical protein